MEVRLRHLATGIVVALLVAAVVTAIFFLLLARRDPDVAIQPSETPTPEIPVLAASLDVLLPTVTPRLAPVTMRDESPTWTWEWDTDCLGNLERHFGTTSARDVSLVLVDDPSLSLGIAYPNMEYPEAIGLTRCTGEHNNLTCRLSVSKGSPGAALDATVMAASLYGVDEFYRLRNRQEWELRAGWEWAQFAPFLTQEGNAWRTGCVHVTAE